MRSPSNAAEDVEAQAPAPPRWLPWTALGLYALACLAWWRVDAWYPEWDSAIYLLTAKAIAAGEGYSYLDRPFFLRPPGFSWLLSFFAGEDGFDFGALNAAVMLLAAASVAAVYAAVRTSGRPWLALGAALLAGTSPLFVANFNWVQSEYLFSALFFLALAALERGLRPGGRWWLWGAAGALALSASIHVRTVGVLLLPALALVAFLRRRDGALKRALLPLGLTALSLVPWTLHTRAAAAQAERPSEQLLLFDYGTALFHVDPGDPDSPRVDLAGWAERLSANGLATARSLARTILGTEADWAALLVGALLVAGFALAARRRLALLAWFSAFAAGLLLTYFTFAERLLVPLVPCAYVLLLVALEAGLRAAARAFAAPRLTPLAGASMCGALLFANALRMPTSMDPAAGGPEAQARARVWQDLERTAAWLREHTPPDAVLLCNQAPILAFLSGRRAFTYRFARTPDLLAKHGVDYVVFDGAYPAALGELTGERMLDAWRLPAKGLPADIGICRVRRP